MQKEPNEMMKLNDLIQVCRDAYQGYWQAAAEIEDKSFRKLFREKALERNDFACDLREIAFKAGLNPEKEGTFSGKVHRTWMNLRHQIHPHKDSVILMECRRGEEHSLGVYQDVFENNWLAEIRPQLEKQFVTMIEMRDLLTKSTDDIGKPDTTGSLLHL